MSTPVLQFIDNTGCYINIADGFTFAFDPRQSGTGTNYVKKLMFFSSSSTAVLSLSDNADSVFSLVGEETFTAPEYTVNDFSGYRDISLVQSQELAGTPFEMYGETYWLYAAYIHCLADSPAAYVAALSITSAQSGTFRVSADITGRNDVTAAEAANIGCAFPEEMLKAVYETDVHDDTADPAIYNRKMKELLLLYTNIKMRRGANRSLLDAVTFFGFDDAETEETWKAETPHRYFNRDWQAAKDILTDDKISFRQLSQYFVKMPYISIYLALSRLKYDEYGNTVYKSDSTDVPDAKVTLPDGTEVQLLPAIFNKNVLRPGETDQPEADPVHQLPYKIQIGKYTGTAPADDQSLTVVDSLTTSVEETAPDKTEPPMITETGEQVPAGASLGAEAGGGADIYAMPKTDRRPWHFTSEDVPEQQAVTYKWSEVDMCLKMKLLRIYLSKLFMPVHMSILDCSVRKECFSSIKLANSSRIERVTHKSSVGRCIRLGDNTANSTALELRMAAGASTGVFPNPDSVSGWFADSVSAGTAVDTDAKLRYICGHAAYTGTAELDTVFDVSGLKREKTEIVSVSVTVVRSDSGETVYSGTHYVSKSDAAALSTFKSDGLIKVRLNDTGTFRCVYTFTFTDGTVDTLVRTCTVADTQTCTASLYTMVAKALTDRGKDWETMDRWSFVAQLVSPGSADVPVYQGTGTTNSVYMVKLGSDSSTDGAVETEGVALNGTPLTGYAASEIERIFGNKVIIFKTRVWDNSIMNAIGGLSTTASRMARLFELADASGDSFDEFSKANSDVYLCVIDRHFAAEKITRTLTAKGQTTFTFARFMPSFFTFEPVADRTAVPAGSNIMAVPEVDSLYAPAEAMWTIKNISDRTYSTIKTNRLAPVIPATAGIYEIEYRYKIIPGGTEHTVMLGSFFRAV